MSWAQVSFESNLDIQENPASYEYPLPSKSFPGRIREKHLYSSVSAKLPLSITSWILITSRISLNGYPSPFEQAPCSFVTVHFSAVPIPPLRVMQLPFDLGLAHQPRIEGRHTSSKVRLIYAEANYRSPGRFIETNLVTCMRLSHSKEDCFRVLL